MLPVSPAPGAKGRRKLMNWLSFDTSATLDKNKFQAQRDININVHINIDINVDVNINLNNLTKVPANSIDR